MQFIVITKEKEQPTTPEQRKEVTCDCDICKSMCVQSPCIPTPEEVGKLIAAGYRSQLGITLLPTFKGVVNPQTGLCLPAVVIAPKKTPTGCTFRDTCGHCTLHNKGLKPLEGRLATHEQSDNGLRQWMCDKWKTIEGVNQLEKLL